MIRKYVLNKNYMRMSNRPQRKKVHTDNPKVSGKMGYNELLR